MRYAVAIKKGSFGLGHVGAQKNFSYCSLLFKTGTIMATLRDSRHYSNDLLQGGLKDCLHFLYMVILLAEACAVIMNSTLIQETFVIPFLFKYCSSII